MSQGESSSSWGLCSRREGRTVQVITFRGERQKILSLSAWDREADEINTHERRRAVGQTGRVRMELQCMKSREQISPLTGHTAEDHTKPHDLR